MDNEFIKRLAAQKKRALTQKSRDDHAAQAIYNDLFPKQRNILDDEYEYVSLLTPRRCGKTHVAISKGLYRCLMNPGSLVIIVTLTLKSAKELYWKPILEFSDKYGLNLRRKGGVHNTNAEAFFENGSRLFLRGAETKAEVEKLRGVSADLIIVDECKSFGHHLFNELIHEACAPALQDRGGQMLILGTPGSILAGEFYAATFPGYTNPEDPDNVLVSRDYESPEPFWADGGVLPNGEKCLPQWSRHHWTQEENKKTKSDIWEASLRKKRMKRWADDNPVWLREHLGHWVNMGDAMVYAYASLITADAKEDMVRCTYKRGPVGKTNKWGLDSSKEWKYVLGMDLGFVDKTAFVVVAYSPTDGSMYLVYEHQESEMIVSDIAERLSEIHAKFEGGGLSPFTAVVADQGGQGKGMIESVNKMYGYNIRRADKQNKFDYIQLLNSDLYDGRVKVPATSELAHEWLGLTWDLSKLTRVQAEKAGRLTEDPSCPNHLSDAFLYTWRYCYHHFSRKAEEPIEEETDEWYAKRDREDADRMVAERSRRQESELLGAESRFSDQDWI